MANKTQVSTVGEQQAAIVINNQFIDGLTKQLEEKCKYGLSFPKDYNLSKENVKFDDDTTDYNKSSLKKLCDTEILKDFEEEFGEENIETDISDLINVDGQKIGETECKVRPLTFDEARKYTELTPNNELDDSYWTCSAWSTVERGWKYTLAVVSPSGDFNSLNYNVSVGVRPVCILKSNLFVSKVEE